MQIRKLNTLRGLAALMVAVSHYSNLTGLWRGVLGHGGGQFGVIIFFLLSAFLMAHLYLETPPTAHAMRRYATARFARVVPLFLVVVGASFAAGSSAALGYLAYEIPDWRSLLSHLLLLRGVNVLWTIPAEIHFYVLFAGAWLAYPRFKRSLALVSTLVLCAYVFGAWPEAPSTTLFGLPASFAIVSVLPYFIVGAGLGYAFGHWQPPARMQSHWYAAALLLLPLLYPDIYFLLTGRSHRMLLDPMILACVSLIFSAVVFLVPAGNPVLETRAGDKLGQVSYSLYLLHFPLLLALDKAGLAGGVLGLLLFLALAIALAIASFTLIEAPARRMIRRRLGVASSVD
jgi:peptidoglycan/LPS O-acetylase OafA/YrhL